jgi:hypothetical protein
MYVEGTQPAGGKATSPHFVATVSSQYLWWDADGSFHPGTWGERNIQPDD